MYKMRTIKLSKYSNYDSDRSRNCGCYAIHKYYEEYRPGMYRIRYATSADFPFCPITGQFRDCDKCDECGPDGCERIMETVGLASLWKHVAKSQREYPETEVYEED